MWFQDLFNYDFRRTEQCIIPYATQEGEISFCAYNTGVGWRNIIEKMHMTATLTKWYEEHGRHEIFAGGKKVAWARSATSSCQHGARQLRSQSHPRPARHRQKLPRRKDARRATNKLKQDAENAQMAKLYREHVLGEKPVEGGMVSIGDIRPASNNATSRSTGARKSRRSRKANSSPGTSIACSSRAFGARKPKTEIKRSLPWFSQIKRAAQQRTERPVLCPNTSLLEFHRGLNHAQR